MRQYFTPKLLFAGLFMLAMTGMTSCNGGSPENPKILAVQTANDGNTAVAASDEDHDDDSDDTVKELEKTKHQLSELSGKVETLESQLSEYKQGHDKANEDLKDEFGIIKVMAIIAIIFSVIAIAISVFLGRKVPAQGNDSRSNVRDNNTNHNRQLNNFQTELTRLKKEAEDNKAQLLLLKKDVTAIKAERGQQQATPQSTYANQRKQDTTPKTQTRTVYFEETENGCFKNESDTEDAYSNYVCKITGNDAVFEPINKLEKLKSSSHLKDAAILMGDKDKARQAEIKPGKAVKEGPRWRITEKAVVRFK